MKILFYQEWHQKRLNKILSIFGKDWFVNKKILELGACYGDFGIELLKLGSDVTFSDCRNEHLDEIKNKLLVYGVEPKTLIIDQENQYNLETKFDLVLHLGTLHHIKNWKQDLECAVRHANYMILETNVSNKISPDSVRKIKQKNNRDQYAGVESYQSIVCQESIEAHLKKLNCKFIRFDNRELNVQSCADFIYDWNYTNITINDSIAMYRRFWFIIT